MIFVYIVMYLFFIAPYYFIIKKPFISGYYMVVNNKI